MRIGFGLAEGTSPDTGIRQVARNLALDALVRLGRDGRAFGALAESWSTTADGLVWRVRLRPAVRFHSGNPANAEAVLGSLKAQLPSSMGPAFDDIREMHAVSERDLEFKLHRRSAFLIEALGDASIEEAGTTSAGTGSFYLTKNAGTDIEMRANAHYYGGRPAIDRIVIKPYTSTRAAWADMLRGQVDALYDVAVDALDSLQSSNEVGVSTFQRGYAYLLLLNTRRPFLSDPAFRRALNNSIDRGALIDEALRGHGTPAEGAVWPHHWAYSSRLPQFRYEPATMGTASTRRRLKCLLPDASLEGLALVVQRQLQAVGVDLEIELVSAETMLERTQRGDFDLVLTDARQGPNMVRPYLFWHSNAPFNWGHYSNKQVDAALDSIQHAADDAAYKVGVAAFQRAIIDDPPAVFLAWRERARAVSRRFFVPPGRDNDILATLHLWRPATTTDAMSRN